MQMQEGINQVAIDHGKGATLWDTEGKHYIDFTSGIGVCSLGYANETWAKAIYDQAMKVGHISNLFYTEPYAKLASKLVPASGMAAAFFGNSGAEANEGMIKTARKYSYEKWEQTPMPDVRSIYCLPSVSQRVAPLPWSMATCFEESLEDGFHFTFLTQVEDQSTGAVVTASGRKRHLSLAG